MAMLKHNSGICAALLALLLMPGSAVFARGGGGGGGHGGGGGGFHGGGGGGGFHGGGGGGGMMRSGGGGGGAMMRSGGGLHAGAPAFRGGGGAVARSGGSVAHALSGGLGSGAGAFHANGPALRGGGGQVVRSGGSAAHAAMNHGSISAAQNIHGQGNFVQRNFKNPSAGNIAAGGKNFVHNNFAHSNFDHGNSARSNFDHANINGKFAHAASFHNSVWHHENHFWHNNSFFFGFHSPFWPSFGYGYAWRPWWIYPGNRWWFPWFGYGWGWGGYGPGYSYGYPYFAYQPSCVYVDGAYANYGGAGAYAPDATGNAIAPGDPLAEGEPIPAAEPATAGAEAEPETFAAATIAQRPVSDAEDAQGLDFAGQGELEFKSGKYEAAIRDWRHALVDDPKNGAIVLLLGQALFAAGQFDEAAGATQQAMRMLPPDKWGTVVENYTQLYPHIQDYTNQLRALEKARDEKLDSPALRFLLGFHYGYLGYPKQAVRELSKGVELAPKDELATKLRDEMAAKLNPAAATPAPEAAPAGESDPSGQ